MPSKIIRSFYGGSGYLSTSELAPYNDTFEVKVPKDLTDTLKDVIAQIFPLPADIDQMQRFLDQYLNFPDGSRPDPEDPPVYFKPAAPFVLMEVANYGRVSENIKNLGWFSQREIAFGMAVEWYARKGDDIQFIKYALFYPYVYVDTALGITAGRAIYGWSKAPIEVATLRRDLKTLNAVPEPLAPAFDPPTDELLVAANLLVPQDKPSIEEGRKKLLEVRRSRYLQAAGSALPDLLTAVPRAVNASLNVGWEAVKFLWESREYGSGQIKALSKTLPHYRGMMSKYLPGWLTETSGYRPGDTEPAGSPTSIITFKQIREVDNTRAGSPSKDEACFQGILESEMSIKRISDGGSLVDLTNPDPSAGISIDLYGIEKIDKKMVELGIIGQEVVRDPKSRKAPVAPGQGERAFRVTPFLPFWVRMDLKYSLADYEVWRTNLTGWTANNTPVPRKERPIRYTRLGAGAASEVPPPQFFPTVRMRVFPIPADPTTIDALIKSYLDNEYKPGGRYFEFVRVGDFPAASGHKGDAVVVAILSDFVNASRTVQKYGDYELTFAIPIRWTDLASKGSGIGLMHALSFVGTYWNTITTSEAYGRSVLRARFESAPFTETLPPTPNQSHVTVVLKSQIFPGGDAYQAVEDLPLLELHQIDDPTKPPVELNSPMIGSGNVGMTVDHVLDELGLPEFKAKADPFYSIALKQVRDGSDPTKADYQASVWLKRKFEQNPKVNKTPFFTSAFELKIYEYENFKFAGSLELKGSQNSGTICVPTISPFFLDGTMNLSDTKIGWWRIGKDGWKGPGFAP